MDRALAESRYRRAPPCSPCLRGLPLFWREWAPVAAVEAFQCREARLVGHFRALGDPIAEIDVRQADAAAFLDQPQDAPGAEAAAAARRVVEAVDGGKAVIQAIDQRHRRQPALGVAE